VVFAEAGDVKHSTISYDQSTVLLTSELLHLFDRGELAQGHININLIRTLPVVKLRVITAMVAGAIIERNPLNMC